jgi:uracil-DNA glycosylase
MGLGDSWKQALSEELKMPYLRNLSAFLEEERKGVVPIYPPSECVFNAFAKCPFHAAKVVIVGQDPYHGQGQAHGLSFSVPHGIAIPPSLKNIFKELATDIGMKIPTTGCLIPWAEQGVLLLNAILTVRSGQPLSHLGRGWEQFTDAAIMALAKRQNPPIFLLWGKSAQEKCRFITQMPSVHVLTASHPSPYSANQGFFKCKHFSKANALLTARGDEPVKWDVL